MITGASVLLIGMASVVLATGAQASHAGQAGQGGRSSGRGYLAKVDVRPGDSLWSVAEKYDPNADPRAIIAEIAQMNSLANEQIQPGEQLWVPLG